MFVVFSICNARRSYRVNITRSHSSYIKTIIYIWYHVHLGHVGTRLISIIKSENLISINKCQRMGEIFKSR